MQSIRTKKEVKEEVKEEGPRKFLVQPRSQAKISWVRTCIAKERKGCDSPFQLLVFILFTLP